MDGPAFAAYVREVPVPEIEPGTVVILDNLATHKNKEAAEGALRAWVLVPLPTAILARPEPNRTGLLQTENPLATHWCKNLHRRLRSRWKSLRPI